MALDQSKPGGLDVMHKQKTGLLKFRDEDTGDTVFAKMSAIETWEIGNNGVRIIMASGKVNRIKSRNCEFDVPWSDLEEAVFKKIGKI